MLEFIAGPQCDAPAELTERFRPDSTDGPIQHLQTSCLSKHWLTPGRDRPPAAVACHPITTSRYCRAARPWRSRRSAPAPQVNRPAGGLR
jgi:hypothetical protein